MPDQTRQPRWKLALLFTLILRGTYSAIAALFSLFIHPNPALIRSNAFTENLPSPHGAYYALLGIWMRFDTLWYLHIGMHGYDRAQATVFYPFYPALIRVAGLLFTPVGAALLISTIAAFFLFWGFLRLCELESPESASFRAMVTYGVWPGSFIFFAGYPESLLIALLIWSLYLARKERWIAATACGILAGLVKTVGALCIVPLIVLAIRAKSRKAWSIMLAPAGALAYLLWLRAAGYPPNWETYSRYWKTDVSLPWRTLWLALQSAYKAPDLLLILNLMAILLFGVLIFVGRLRLGYALYSLAVLLLLLTKTSTPLLQSSIRYLLAVFPAFMVVGRILERPWLASRFPLFCAALMILNLAWLWTFLNWSLVL